MFAKLSCREMVLRIRTGQTPFNHNRMVKGEPRIGLFAGPLGVNAGSEITYDYNFRQMKHNHVVFMLI